MDAKENIVTGLNTVLYQYTLLFVTDKICLATESRQEAESHGQSLQEAIYQAQQSRQEARNQGQSRGKPNMMDSLCRKRKLADSFIPCVQYLI